MDAFTGKLVCPQCGSGFRVELSRMRLNYPNVCPSCGSPYEISSDQAIKAHRLLEKLESMKRVTGPAGPAHTGEDRFLNDHPEAQSSWRGI